MGTFRELGENILETTKSKNLEINISTIPKIIWNHRWPKLKFEGFQQGWTSRIRTIDQNNLTQQHNQHDLIFENLF
jgi:hypothetical protein